MTFYLSWFEHSPPSSNSSKSFQHLQKSNLKCVHQHFFWKGVWNLLNSLLFIVQASWFKVWLTILIFCIPLTMFGTIIWILLGLLHLSMASLLCCVCTESINSFGIQLLKCAHGSEHTWTHAWCGAWCHCIHCSKSWILDGMWTISNGPFICTTNFLLT